MKAPSLCSPMTSLVLSISAICLILVFGNVSLTMILLSAAAFAITYGVTESMIYGTISGICTLFAIALLMKKGVIRKEGFNVFTAPSDISKMLRKLKHEGFKSKDDDEEGYEDDDERKEGYRGKDDDEEGYEDDDERKEGYRGKDDDEEGYEDDDEKRKEGFISQVFQNITKAGYNSPGFGMAGPLVQGVEGFEDAKKAEKKGVPAPVAKEAPKKEMPTPFKLGEIPSQVKDGPHIDAGSTLMSAIKTLDPAQINAMTKDTKQLIETQKSLMGMLGTMKPMMNDGKELMETFQQMFGENGKIQ